MGVCVASERSKYVSLNIVIGSVDVLSNKKQPQIIQRDIDVKLRLSFASFPHPYHVSSYYV